MIHTLMMRLVKDDRKALEFDYMGAAEYEFGSSHKALNLLLCDPLIPLVDTETSFRIRKRELDWFVPKAPRGSSRFREMEKQEFIDLSAMADGQPLLLRHAPSMTSKEEMSRLLSVTNSDGIHNKGGFLRRNTRAWLFISPVPGILYHPSRAGEVDAFLHAIRTVREEKEADLKVRASASIMEAVRERWLQLEDRANLMRVAESVANGHAAMEK